MKFRLRLWGLKNERLDFRLSLLTIMLLAFSRFAFLASGPREWDETLFARGMLHFELAAHFPHPPGFPGWLAIGRLLLPLAGTPLRALQLASAGFSLLAFLPLFMLGRKVAPPAVATTSALLVLFLPGTWLFAERGFSSTGAGCCILLGALCLCRLRDEEKRPGPVPAWFRDRATAFTLLLTLAFLIRPILLPTIGLLWLGGAWLIRDVRRLLGGALVGMAAVCLSVVIMVQLEGGWSPFVEAFAVHALHQKERLYLNTAGFSQFSVVKACGGPEATLFLAAWSLLGLQVWARKRGRRAAILWLSTISLTITQFALIQNRSCTRYSVPVQMAAGPLIAGAMSLLPTAPATVFLAGGTLISAAWSLPILREQRDRELPAWSATRAAEETAGRNNWAFVAGPEIHPFASYLQHLENYQGRSVPQMLLSPRAPEPWEGIDRPWVVATIHPELYLPSLSGRQQLWTGVSERLYPMTLQRFYEAAILENPPLPLGEWWTLNHTPEGDTFMWGGPQAKLLLPPLPERSWIGVRLRPAPGPEALAVSLDGEQTFLVGGTQPRMRFLWFFHEKQGSSLPSTIRFQRQCGYAPGRGDERPLSVQVFEILLQPPGTPMAGPLSSEEEQEKLRIHIEGAYPPENFGASGTGIWLEPEAQLKFETAESGELRLRVCAPRPLPPETHINIGGRPASYTGSLNPEPGDISFHIDRSDIDGHSVDIRLSSKTFRPSEHGSPDQRALGIVLMGMEFVPDQTPLTGWWSAAPPPATTSKASSAR